MEKGKRGDWMISAPVFKRKQQERIPFDNKVEKIFGTKAPENAHMKVQLEKMVALEAENADMKVQLEKMVALEAENADMKVQLEKMVAPKKELVEKIKSLEAENAAMKEDIEKLLNEDKK
jgi:predicted nuclease with TOPRIM domain